MAASRGGPIAPVPLAWPLPHDAVPRRLGRALQRRLLRRAWRPVDGGGGHRRRGEFPSRAACFSSTPARSERAASAWACAAADRLPAAVCLSRASACACCALASARSAAVTSAVACGFRSRIGSPQTGQGSPTVEHAQEPGGGILHACRVQSRSGSIEVCGGSAFGGLGVLALSPRRRRLPPSRAALQRRPSRGRDGAWPRRATGAGACSRATRSHGSCAPAAQHGRTRPAEASASSACAAAAPGGRGGKRATRGFEGGRGFGRRRGGVAPPRAAARARRRGLGQSSVQPPRGAPGRNELLRGGDLLVQQVVRRLVVLERGQLFRERVTCRAGGGERLRRFLFSLLRPGPRRRSPLPPSAPRSPLSG